MIYSLLFARCIRYYFKSLRVFLALYSLCICTRIRANGIVQTLRTIIHKRLLFILTDLVRARTRAPSFFSDVNDTSRL